MGLEISTYLEFMILVSFNMYDIFLFSSSEKTFICFTPRQGPEFRLVIFLLMNSQSRVVKSVNPGFPNIILKIQKWKVLSFEFEN
jgi:hypothetical protein